MNVTKLSLENIFMELTGAKEDTEFDTVLGASPNSEEEEIMEEEEAEK